MINWEPGIVKLKDPSDVLNYKFKFSDWLAAGETISAKTVTVDSGLTKNSDVLADTDTSVVVQLSGGTAGTTYTVACKITATDTQEIERSIQIQVVNL